MKTDKFILLTTHRSGTRLLLTALGDGSQIQCHKRVFALTDIFGRFTFDRITSPFFKFRSASPRRQIDYFLRKQQLVNDFLTELCTPTDDVKAVGVRVTYEQVAKHPEILEWAMGNEAGIIHLIRKNSLKAVVYTEASLQQGLFTRASRAEPVTTMRLSPARLKMQLTRLTQHIEKYRAMLQDARYLEVFYESLAANRETEIQRVLDFFNIEQFQLLASEPVEQSHGSLENIIENYDEIEQALRGTAFEKFLQDVEKTQTSPILAE